LNPEIGFVLKTCTLKWIRYEVSTQDGCMHGGQAKPIDKIKTIKKQKSFSCHEN